MNSSTSNSQRFDFQYLYDFTHSANTPQSYIIHPFQNQSVLALTYEGCVNAVGHTFEYYGKQDVYDKVILWRLPLLGLWATTTLPALGIVTQIFTLAHLIADPIDTVWSLLFKLDLAQRTSHWAKRKDRTRSSFVFPSESGISDSNGEKATHVHGVVEVSNVVSRTNAINRALRERHSALVRYFHDVPALIITAYDEWGYGDQASEVLNYGFNMRRWTPVQRTLLRKRCAKAAFLIASDRVSRFLPSAASTVVFVVQIFAGFWKTLAACGDTYNESNHTSVGLARTPHNIAFGVLFFWLPFLVLLTALVGGSQTSHMTPKVLEELRQDFAESYDLSQSATRQPLSAYESENFPDLSLEKEKRWSCGGLPVWQTEKYQDLRKPTGGGPSHRSFAWGAMVLSFCIVAVPAASAMTISARSPAGGFGCRPLTQLSFLLMWVLSASFDALLFACAGYVSPKARSGQDVKSRTPKLAIYRITLVKDLMFTLATILTLTWSALGMYNRCECWCTWTGPLRYLTFTQDDFIFQRIVSQLSMEFPSIVGGALVFQIVTFAGVWVHFRKGHRVLKQRDIDSVLRSQNSCWNKLMRLLRRMCGWRDNESNEVFELLRSDSGSEAP